MLLILHTQMSSWLDFREGLKKAVVTVVINKQEPGDVDTPDRLQFL